MGKEGDMGDRGVKVNVKWGQSLDQCSSAFWKYLQDMQMENPNKGLSSSIFHPLQDPGEHA